MHFSCLFMSILQSKLGQTESDRLFSLPYTRQPFGHGSEVSLSPCPAIWALSMSTKMHPNRSARAGGRIKGQSGKASTTTINGTIYRDVHTQQETELKETVHYLSVLCVSALCTTLTLSHSSPNNATLSTFACTHTKTHTCTLSLPHLTWLRSAGGFRCRWLLFSITPL